MDEVRCNKLQAIRDKEVCPYAHKFDKSFSIKELTDDFQENKEVRTAGRLFALRSHGKSVFADLRDQSGKMQIYLKSDT
ncbi:MAG: OB-fold nucleic acid binding domain-containing protein, partial [Candidatus Omnitrophota bacterium]